MTNWLYYIFLFIMVNDSVSNRCELTKGSIDDERVALLREAELNSDDQDLFQEERKLSPSLNKTCETCSCGLRMTNLESSEDRISSYAFPWLVILRRNGTNFCLGTLINELYVLTAASCIWNKNPVGSLLKEIKILFPIYDRSQMRIRSARMRRIGDVKVHPKFSPNSKDSDIALLKFQTPVKFSIGIAPICLPEKGKSYVGYWGSVTGLGTMHGRYKRPILTQSNVPIITQSHCTNPYYGYNSKMKPKMTKTMLCTASWNKDLCLMARGGPLTVEDMPGLTQIVGINSWGSECDGPEKPTVYTKVTRFLDWILENTADACFCATF